MPDEQRTKVWIGILVSSAAIQLFFIVLITAFEDGRYSLGKAAVQALAGLIFCAGILLVRKNMRRAE